MKKKNLILTILLLIPFLTFATTNPKDSLKTARKEKAKQFFSLEQKKEIHELYRYTTLDDSIKPRKPEKKWGASLSGFIGFDFFWDTRKMVDLREGALILYPENVLLDKEGNDINARAAFNFVAMNTRLTFDITAPDALGAKITGKIEGWFIGTSNADANGFALRHAYMKMDWKKATLLMGQTWHPMFIEQCFPMTVAGSAGAPFQVLTREPQIRFIQRFKNRHEIHISANSNMNKGIPGMNGGAAEYLRHGLVPEIGLQYHYQLKKEHAPGRFDMLRAGIAGSYMTIVPRKMTGDTVITNKRVHAFSALLFATYVKQFSSQLKFQLKAKATYTQLGAAYYMMGGYAIEQYEFGAPLNPNVDYNYVPINAMAGWIDLSVFKNSWEFGVFAGMGKNLGTTSPIQDCNNPNSYLTRHYNADILYKISIRTRYTANKIQFCFEPEYSSAVYASKLNEYGTIDYSAPSNFVYNLRFLFGATLFF